MHRREFLSRGSLTLGVAATPVTWRPRGAGDVERIEPPKEGRIRVAVAISQGATVIDFCGPWEVFHDVETPEHPRSPFELMTVAETRDPVRVTGGLHIVPDFTFEDAPEPHVVLVPAMRGSEALWAWLKASAVGADLVLSVCTGAFQLGRAGLLAGKRATTHHMFYGRLEEEFPDVEVQRGLRWVDNGQVASAGGLTSGLDLALHVVARYFGEEQAARTAAYLEYQSEGWRG